MPYIGANAASKLILEPEAPIIGIPGINSDTIHDKAAKIAAKAISLADIFMMLIVKHILCKFLSCCVVFYTTLIRFFPTSLILRCNPLPSLCNKAKHVSQCMELAILLEVSADKPGNVNLVVGFEGTNHAHFLASAVAASRHFEIAAERGMAVSSGEIGFSDVGLGRIIRDCVADVSSWQSGGNTLLGTVILFSPLAQRCRIGANNKGLCGGC